MKHNVNEQVTPDFGAGDALLDSLLEHGVIKESTHSLIFNKQMIAESTEILTESKENTPTSYVHKGRRISWELFKAIYTSYDDYQTIQSIWDALGFKPEWFEPGPEAKTQSREGNMRKSLDRIVKHFRTNNADARKLLVTYGDRMKAYSRHSQERLDDNEDDLDFDPYRERPTRDEAIFPGHRNRRNRSTQIIDRINSQELMPGEFYSDFTRIAPSKWGSWLRFWERDVSSVKHDKSLFGRTWKKFFVLGYQLETNLIYEIWYNSIDSTFTIHDYRGNQMLRKFPSLSEAIKGVFNAAVQASNRDSEVFTSLNNNIAVSIGRAMATGLDTFVDDVQRLEKKEHEDAIRKREEAEKKKKEYDAEQLKMKAEIKKQAAANRAAWSKQMEEDREEGIEQINRVKDRAADLATQFGHHAADAMLKSYERGKVNAEFFAKKTAEMMGIFGTPEEKEIRSRFVRGDIGIDDYVLEVRSLAAKIKGQKAREAADEYRRKSEELAKAAEKKTPAPKKPAAKPSTSKAVATKPSAAAKPKATAKGLVTQAASRKSRTNLTESFTYLAENFESLEAQEEAIDDVVDSSSYLSGIRKLRKEASSSYTQNAVRNTVNSELIELYKETRVNESQFTGWISRWMNVGRKDPVVLPTDKRSLWNRIKMAISGQRYQADFIVGFNLSNAVNIEIWYVTEPNPEYALSDFISGDANIHPVVSTFYVFDVTSGRLLRKFVPYYRNAVQIAMAKISAL
tara:strand:- start:821 stop:3037 length:2217 start_codon:yes stop_codon:yes gene_type:complete